MNRSPGSSSSTSAVTVDLHAHPAMKTYLLGKRLHKRYRPGGAFNPFAMRTTLPRLVDGGIDVLLSAIYLPELGLLDDCWLFKVARFFAPGRIRSLFEGSRLERTLALIDAFEEAVRRTPPLSGKRLELAHSRRQLADALRNGNIALVHTVEGAHSLDGDAANVRALFERGVAILTLAHFYENGVAPPVDAVPQSFKKLSCFKQPKDLSRRLPGLGVEVIEEMIRLGMLIDLTHMTPPARGDALELVARRAPVLITHVGVRKDPMNPEEREIHGIAETGGLVGIIFFNHWLTSTHQKNGVDLIIETVKTIRQHGGIDTVALGSDFDGMTDPPDDLATHSDLDNLRTALSRAGFSTTDIEKVIGGNVMRVLQGSWGA